MNKIISTPLIALGLMSILSSAIVQAGTPADKQFMAAMQSSERADADKARDENRKPSKVMKFLV